nr:hypothetical protein [Ignavibacteriaceae bacterium]
MNILTKIILLALITANLFAQSITIHKRDAEVWSTSQLIKGRLNDFYSASGILYLNSNPIAFSVSSMDSSFTVPVTIDEGMSSIFIDVSGIISDTLNLELAYNIRPEI